MAFQKPTPRTPSKIKNIVITLTDIPALDTGTEIIPARQAFAYAFQVLDANGDRISLPVDSGDLEPHLTAQQRTQLKAFLATLRTKIEAEILN